MELGLDGELREAFGGIDVYLFDQLLKGRLRPPMRVLEVGCGTGRNLPYFLTSGFEVFAVDADADATATAKSLYAPRAKVPAWFGAARAESLPFFDHGFDAVICVAVLHFAAHASAFAAQVREQWRVLKPGGIFFARMGCGTGLPEAMTLPDGRHRLPERTEWFLTDQNHLTALGESLGAEWVEPYKTSLIPGRRSMATVVWRKRIG